MSRRDRYPEITSERLPLDSRKQCQAVDCKHTARYRIEIRQTYMRGDDDVFVLCDECREAVSVGNPSTFNRCRRVYKMTGNYHGDSNT